VNVGETHETVHVESGMRYQPSLEQLIQSLLLGISLASRVLNVGRAPSADG